MRSACVVVLLLVACSSAPAPVISAIDLPRGFTEGGAPRRLSGAHFRDGLTITFGGTDATDVVVVSPEAIELSTPPHAAGSVDVEISDREGHSAKLDGGFTYVERTGTPGCRAFSQRRPAGCEAAKTRFELKLSDVGRGGAGQVLLAGEFTGWASGALPLDSQGNGTYAREVALPPGKHEYKFIVDGTWFADPHADIEPIFGNSVKTVADACLPEATLDAPELGAVLPAGTVRIEGHARAGRDGSGTARTIPDDGLVLCVDERKIPVKAGENGAISAEVTLGAGRHRASLQLRDGGGFTSRTVSSTFTIAGHSMPIADAGPTQFVRLGQDVLLDGAGSFDPDGAPLATYTWTELDGPMTVDASKLPDSRVSAAEGYRTHGQDDPNALPPTTSARKAFHPGLAGTYTFALEVKNAAGVSGKATTSVVVLPASGPRPRVVLSASAPRHGPVVIDAGASTRGSAAQFRWMADPHNSRPIVWNSFLSADGTKLTIPAGTLGEGAWRFWTWIEEGGGASWPGGVQVLVRDGRVRVDDALLAPAWARETTIDEIFVRRFVDSDGDGQGDLNGLASKLDYLQGLGIETLWLMPIFVSNDHDHGYHTVDYLDVDPDLGTREDLAKLIREVHRRGMKLILDLAINHTSRRHPFFDASVNAVRNGSNSSFFRDFYVWFDNGQTDLVKRYGYGRELGGDRLGLETGWAEIPDIDFGSGQARRYFFDVARFWVDPNGDGDFSDGVDGYRLDHVTGPEHPVWNALRTELKALNPDLLLLAEVFRDFDNGGAGYGLKDYYRGEIDAAFTFPLYWDFEAIFANGEKPARLKNTFEQIASDRFPPGALHVSFLENHDVPTGTTAFNRYGLNGMRAALALQAGLPPVPQAVWGEELGSTAYRAFPPWDKEGAGNALETHFRSLMTLRRGSPALRRGALTWLSCDRDGVLAFARTLEGSPTMVVAAGTGGQLRATCSLGGLASEGAKLASKLGGSDITVGADGKATFLLESTGGDVFELTGP